MSIKITLGCMFSGKTSKVIEQYKKWKSIGKTVLCINNEIDNRYGNDDKMYNHNLDSVKCIKVKNLSDVTEEEIKMSDIILINEGQFFSDLKECCVKWCEQYSKHIIISGLDGDFERNKFGQILDLIPYSDEVEKMHAFCAICKDGTHALFTKRVTNEKEQILVGSSNYIAVCRKHYL